MLKVRWSTNRTDKWEEERKKDMNDTDGWREKGPNMETIGLRSTAWQMLGKNCLVGLLTYWA